MPGEIQNQIYELVLLQGDDFPITLRDNPGTAGLLRVNKLVHQKATPIFYGKNCFNLREYLAYDDDLLPHIGAEAALHIRHIIIDWPHFWGKDSFPVRLSGEETLLA
jgi:hypothetical protein